MFSAHPPQEIRLPSLWMQVAVFGLLSGLGLAAPSPADAAQDSGRMITASAMSGARFFNEDLDLKTDISFGARVAMGLTNRWGLAFDFLASHPVRKSTNQEDPIDALRMLGRANVLTGRLRPYVVAGFGTLIFFFNDARQGAEAAFTLGAGADYRFGPRVLVFLEGTADYYRQEPIVYTPTGQVFSTGPRETEHLGAATVGVGVEF